MPMDLLTRVRNRQLELQETDARFSARLKVSKACWIKTRETHMPIGWAIACGIMQDRELADLQIDVLAYMREWRSSRKRRQSARAA